jgi:hypothetical protein
LAGVSKQKRLKTPVDSRVLDCSGIKGGSHGTTLSLSSQRTTTGVAPGRQFSESV